MGNDIVRKLYSEDYVQYTTISHSYTTDFNVRFMCASLMLLFCAVADVALVL